MPDGASIAETSSFFAASISIVFGVWYEGIALTLIAKMPTPYRDRKPYIRSLWRVLLTKVVPLGAFLIGYMLIFGGRFLGLLFHRELASFYGGGQPVDLAASVFCLIYLVIAYLAAITISQALGVLKRLASAAKGRAAGDKRISIIL